MLPVNDLNNLKIFKFDPEIIVIQTYKSNKLAYTLTIKIKC